MSAKKLTAADSGDDDADGSNSSGSDETEKKPKSKPKLKPKSKPTKKPASDDDDGSDGSDKKRKKQKPKPTKKKADDGSDTSTDTNDQKKKGNGKNEAPAAAAAAEDVDQLAAQLQKMAVKETAIEKHTVRLVQKRFLRAQYGAISYALSTPDKPVDVDVPFTRVGHCPSSVQTAVEMLSAVEGQCVFKGTTKKKNEFYGPPFVWFAVCPTDPDAALKAVQKQDSGGFPSDMFKPDESGYGPVRLSVSLEWLRAQFTNSYVLGTRQYKGERSLAVTITTDKLLPCANNKGDSLPIYDWTAADAFMRQSPDGGYVWRCRAASTKEVTIQYDAKDGKTKEANGYLWDHPEVVVATRPNRVFHVPFERLKIRFVDHYGWGPDKNRVLCQSADAARKELATRVSGDVLVRLQPCLSADDWQAIGAIRIARAKEEAAAAAAATKRKAKAKKSAAAEDD